MFFDHSVLNTLLAEDSSLARELAAVFVGLSAPAGGKVWLAVGQHCHLPASTAVGGAVACLLSPVLFSCSRRAELVSQICFRHTANNCRSAALSRLLSSLLLLVSYLVSPLCSISSSSQTTVHLLHLPPTLVSVSTRERRGEGAAPLLTVCRPVYLRQRHGVPASP